MEFERDEAWDEIKAENARLKQLMQLPPPQLSMALAEIDKLKAENAMLKQVMQIPPPQLTQPLLMATPFADTLQQGPHFGG